MRTGLAASVMLHAVLAVVLWQHGDALLSGSRAGASGVLVPLVPPPAKTDPAPDDPDLQNDPVRLGIADGVAETETWLGFRDPTRHVATPANVDQASFTIATGPINDGIVGGESVAPFDGENNHAPSAPPVPPDAASDTTPDAAPIPSSPPPVAPTVSNPVRAAHDSRPDRPEPGAPESSPSMPPPTRTPDAHESDAPGTLSLLPSPSPRDHERKADSSHPRPDASDDGDTDAVGEDVATTEPDGLHTAEDPPADRPEQPTEPDARTSPPPDFTRPVPPEARPARGIEPVPAQPFSPGRRGIPTTIGSRPGTSGRPGERTDQHSDATSTLRDVIDVVPGRPAAAKGLKIKTTPPRWSVTTTLVRAVRNPVVSITFGKSGRVIRAGFVRGYNAGSPDVDGPLLDAIHEWRAEGELLRTIPDEPHAGITITMRITLRGA